MMPLACSAVPLTAASIFAVIPDIQKFIQPVVQLLGMIQEGEAAVK